MDSATPSAVGDFAHLWASRRIPDVDVGPGGAGISGADAVRRPGCAAVAGDDPGVDAWITACVRARFAPSALDGLAEWAGHDAARWCALADGLAAGRLEGLALPALRGALGVPPAVVEHLRRARAGYAAHNALLLAAAASAVRRLEENGIRCLVLKGAAMLETLYRDVGARPLADIDLLVPAADARRAAEVLRADGYGWAGPTDVAKGLAFENELMLRRPGPVDLLLELHWHLIDSPFYQRHLPEAWLWASTAPFTLAGRPARMLAPTPMLLHLCAHIVLHHGQAPTLGLRRLADIAEWLRVAGDNPSFDWSDVAPRARACGLVVATRRALGEAADRLGAPVPGAVRAELNGIEPSADERRAVARLTAPDPSVAARFVADLASLPGIGARLRFAMHNAIPSPAYMRARYGRDGVGLGWSYARRWWSGARDAAQHAGRLLRQP